MRTPVAALTFLLVCFTSVDSAQAMLFGRSEKIHKIQPIDDEYSLSHKLTIYYFVAGVYLKDDGYVAQERGISDTYIPLTPAMIGELQTEGLLPKPLPEYSIPLIDYAAGFSLWLIIAAIGLFVFISSLFERISGKSEDVDEGGTCGVQLEIAEELPPVCALCGSAAETFKAKSFEAADGSSLGLATGLAGSVIDETETNHYTFTLPLCWEHAKQPDALSKLQAVAHGPRSAILIGVDRNFAMAVQEKQSEHAQDVADTMRFLDQE